jgi:uncharacterized protein YggE
MTISSRLALLAALSAAVAIASVAATCGSTTTQIDNNESQQRGITVAGSGKVAGAPDIADISLGVSTLGASVAEARDRAATALDAMIASLKDNGVAEKDIQTSNLSIYPEYDYDGNRQTLRGFRVQNTVAATVRDIDRTGEIVDDAVNAGGDDTTIQGITFAIDNPDDLKRQARELAVQDARARAQTLADASGVGLGDPITISETSYSPPLPYFERGAAAADSSQAAPETPIETGELDVVIEVSVTWDIGD